MQIDYKLSMTHSFFVSMGGLVQPAPSGILEDGYQVITADMIGNEVPIEVIYSVPLKEITTRSKGDSFSKAVCRFHTNDKLHRPVLCSWSTAFASHRTRAHDARLCHTQHNHFFWWFKPYKIDRPIIIVCPVDSARPLDFSEAMPSNFFDGFLRGIFGKPFLSSSKLPLFSPGMRQSSDPSFDDAALFFFLTSATIFGGIHLIAWDSFFPSHTELAWLWRISAAAITGGPLLVIVLSGMIGAIEDGLVSSMSKILSSLLPFPYVTARIILLVIMFTSLRRLPYDIYKGVSWTSFLPHFG
jgi:hypothetical protein